MNCHPENQRFISSPWSIRWREFRNQWRPRAVFLTVLVAIAALWRERIVLPPLPAQAGRVRSTSREARTGAAAVAPALAGSSAASSNKATALLLPPGDGKGVELTVIRRPSTASLGNAGVRP